MQYCSCPLTYDPRLAPPSWITAHGALCNPMTSDRHKVVVNASQREVMKPATQTFCTCVELYMAFLQAKHQPVLHIIACPYKYHCQTEDSNLKRNSAPHLVMCPTIPHLSLVPEFNHASFSNKYFTGGKFSKQSHEGVWVGERSRPENRWISPCGSISCLGTP